MKPGKLLIVDDEKDIRSLMQEIFSEEGYEVMVAANGQQAQAIWRDKAPDLIFLDIWMPDIDGISLLKEMIAENVLDHSSVIMMSGHGTIETAIEATKLGAYDFLEKPLSLAKLLITAERAMEHLHLHSENRHLKQKLPDQILPIGKSKLIVELRDSINRLAKYSMPILVKGEPGTGKHRLAEAIHKLGDSKEQPLFEIHAPDFDEQE
ncbi:MAG: sigma-54-dependent Fis family transcriptional regulator, partial [Hydrogenovibrio crunogenus]|nr:sigma-54-dependent Fis family transcriptional regulator [Hydrogenovibrio crunogenus]